MAQPTDPPVRRPLAFDYDQHWSVWAIPAGLIASLTLNIAALKAPFVMMTIFPDPAEPYSIPHTIQLMWSVLEIYWVAILITIFSLIFPFVKLLMLAIAWFVPLAEGTRGRLLSALGMLGRWSLLDVFVTLVLIVLAHDQGQLFVTDVKSGLLLFMTAIVLAMITGDVAHHLHDRARRQPDVEVKAVSGGWWLPIVVILLVVGSAVSLVAAFYLPFLKITAWFLSKQSYSILRTVETLWGDHDRIFAVAIALFLVVTPVLRLGMIVHASLRIKSLERLRTAMGRLDVVSRWAALDVFGLAIGLFLVEGSNLVPIETRGGVWGLVVAIALNAVLGFAAGQFLKGRLRRLGDAASAGSNSS